MKCKICGGTGTSNTCVNGTFKPCTFCDGTGEYEPFDTDVELDKLDNKPMTNDEWRRTCSTEEFAEWITELSELCTIHHQCELCDGWCDEKKVMEWLKEKHDE